MDRPTPFSDERTLLGAQIDALLRKAGLRVTRPRQVLTEVLLRAQDHPTVDEILVRARRIDPSITQATAYRTMAILAEHGFALAHNFDAGPTRYEAKLGQHHDHFIDLDEGKITEFVSEKIEALQAQIAREHGYYIVHHRLELYVRKLKPSGDDEPS